MNHLDVHRKCQRQWTSNIPIIPTKEVEVNERCSKPLEYRSRLCGEEFVRCNSTVECAMFDPSSRKIMFLDVSARCCLAGATSETAIKIQVDEQVVCQDLIT